MDNQKPLPVFDAPPSRKSVASSTRTSAQFTAQPREEVVLPVFDVLPPPKPNTNTSEAIVPESTAKPHEEIPLPVFEVQPPPNPVTVELPLGPNPTIATCPYCRAKISTKIKIEPSTNTMAGIMFVLCFPCMFLPNCMSSCKVTNHYCPKCHAHLGSYTDGN